MNYNENIKNIREMVRDKKFIEAENMLISTIQDAKIKNIEDENNTYYCFNRYIESLLFWNFYKPQKKNVNADVNYPEIYFYLSFINVEQGKLDKSIEYLQEGLKWNPLDVALMFEQAAIYRMQGKLEVFREKVKNIHRYIFKKSDLAKFFRFLGIYYLETMQFDIANAVYTVSFSLEEKETIKSDLMFIAKKENREFKFSTQEEIEVLFKKYDIPLTYNKDMLDILLKEYERLSLFKPPVAASKYLAPVLYDITHEEKYKQMIDRMTSYSRIVNENKEFKVEYKNSIEKWEKDFKIAFECYEEGKIRETIKLLENNINAILLNDLTLKQDIYWKVLTSSVFKSIVLNYFHNKKEITLEDFSLILENEEELKKNISEFCNNFRNNQDINFIRQIEDIHDKALKDVRDILKLNIGKLNNEENKIRTVVRPLTIECPICNNSFDLMWQIPDTQKTFYCTCPNCKTQLKRGNPNYREN